MRFDVETGAATRLALPPEAVPHVFAMVDDESALVAFGEPLQIRRVDARRSRTLARGLHAVRMAGQPLVVVGTRGGPRGSLRVVAIDRRSGRQRTIRAGLYTFHGLSADGSTVLVDDHLMHLGTGERTRLHAFAVRGRAHRIFEIDSDRNQGSPDWTWDASASRVVGNPHPSDTRFGSHPVSYRQASRTHYVVDDGSGPPPLVFRAGIHGDAGPWVDEHRVSPDGHWDLFVLTRNGTPPSCPPGEHGFRVRRELLLMPLGPGQPRRQRLDERAWCRRIPMD